ncbi:MAG: hypothetical protein JXJ22_17625 [Bacteroidales bacterium]|nr:hypothetical protein [Bacteroidales bacterium]
MSKRNKKKKKHPQHAKQIEAEQRKAFFRNIRRILKLYGCEDVYPLIPDSELKLLYLTRFRQPRLKPAEGHDICLEDLRIMRILLSRYFKEQMVEMTPKGISVSLMDHFTLNHTLFILRKNLMEEEIPGWEKIVNKFDQCVDLVEAVKWLPRMSHIVCDSIAITISNLEQNLFWIKLKFDSVDYDGAGKYLNLDVYTAKPEVISYHIEGKKRLLYRVGWGSPEKDVQWSSMQLKSLNIINLCSELPLPVYIQSHALHRLYERIDCYFPGYLQYHLYRSLENPVVINFEGRILIEYIMYGIKYGYLVAECIDGFILIRTFLFITNNGTPEGKKLAEISGLKKLDKKYWAIDKLSTFYASDIENNEELKALFTEAGCNTLFENKHESLATKESSGMAEKIVQYLKLDEKPILAD